MRFLFPFLFFLRLKAYGLLIQWLFLLGITAGLIGELNQYMNGLEYAFRVHRLGSPEDSGLQGLKNTFRICAFILFCSLYFCGGFLIKGGKSDDS